MRSKLKNKKFVRNRTWLFSLVLAVLLFGFIGTLLQPQPAFAAIGQTAWKTQEVPNDNPATMDFDCNGGDLLVLGMAGYFTPRAGGAPTYNGVEMIDSGQGIVEAGMGSIVEMWYLVNPASGENTISIPNTNLSDVYPIASAWSGVDTADPLDTSNSDFNDGSANPSVQVTTAAANELVIDVMNDQCNDVPTGNSHTLITSVDHGGFSSNVQYTTSQDPAGNITLDWTVPSDNWAMIVCAFNADTPPNNDPPQNDYPTQDPNILPKTGADLY